MRRHLFAVITLTTALAGTARAQAPEGAPPAVPAADPNAAPPPPSSGGATGGDAASQFGLQGQIVISGELQASVLHESASMGGGSATLILVQPALDYFVAPNVSIGGTLTIQHASGSGGSGDATAFGIAARAGYNLHLAPIVSFWPQLQLGYVHQSAGSGATSFSGYSVPISIFAPILVHVTTHLFVGIGPVFSTELISKVQSMDASKTTDIGLSSVVGGYFP